MNLSRLESLIGIDKVDKIKKLNILILGLGGVGGYAVESLARSGVENITLVDGDTIKPSNLNRQIVTTRKNINKYKTREFKKRIKSINKDANITLINGYITNENMYLLFIQKYDYIVDACDDSKIKIALINECINRNIKLISSMGTANKLDATSLEITTLDKTDNDPLARKVRKGISKENQEKIIVVTSKEKKINNIELGSTSYVPAVAGLLITNYIIKDTIS